MEYLKTLIDMKQNLNTISTFPKRNSLGQLRLYKKNNRQQQLRLYKRNNKKILGKMSQDVEDDRHDPQLIFLQSRGFAPLRLYKKGLRLY